MKKIILLSLLFSGCVTRKEIDAALWNNNFGENLKEICLRNPEIKDYGFYRKLNSGGLEFVSICNPQAIHYKAMYDKDLQKILDQALPQKK